jgi:hypothetical protein
MHTPVVGATKGGNRLLLSGQCELTALRELGVKKMDAIEVEVSGDGGVRAKLSLLLISLRDKPGALCEGQLLQEAVSAGVPRSEIQAMLGKSASWVSNRLSLVTRLDGNVYELVRSGLIEPRSAQEIARLPVETQFTFAEVAVREGLPKSAIESLVAGYNDAGCPDEVKAQILTDPRAALLRMTDKRRAVSTSVPGGTTPDSIDLDIKAAKSYIACLSRIIFKVSAQESGAFNKVLTELESGLSALLLIVRGLVSPGKTEVAHNAG